MTQEGQRLWQPDEIPAQADPFVPLAVRLVDRQGHVIETARSSEPFCLEVEYKLKKAIKGLRVGIYIITSHGEFVFTSFDTDDPESFEQHPQRAAGSYVSRCEVPAHLLNGGRFVVGVNASSYRIKTYFHDEQALAFNVDAAGAPGTHWPETRLGPVRPLLKWQIQKTEGSEKN